MGVSNKHSHSSSSPSVLTKTMSPTSSVFKALQRSQARAGSAIVGAPHLHHSAASPTQPSPKPVPQSQNLFSHLREARPAIRYTVYAGLGLMAAAESTFWFHVLRAKFFPRTTEAGRQRDDELLNRFKSATKGYRQVWMRNYQRYYAAHMWGLGYGSLDSLDDADSSLA
jgi:hypothetical protein